MLLKCVPHVQHDYCSSFNQSDHCFLVLLLPSSLLKLPRDLWFTDFRHNIFPCSIPSSSFSLFFFSGLETPGRCDFEAGGLCHWQNMTDDTFDWRRLSGRTPSLFTGPSYDHTIGFGGQGKSDPLVVNNEPPLL